MTLQMSKTILFDGRFLSLENAGLGRYSSELFKNLLEVTDEKKIKYLLLVLPGAKFDSELKESIKNNPELVDVIEFDAKHYSLSEQTQLRRFLNEINPDLVHFTNLNHPVLYKGRFVVTIHDLTLYKFSERANFARKMAYNFVINRAARNSQRIFAVSEYAKRQLAEKFSLNIGKIVVTYNGIDEKFKKITSPKALERASKYKLNRPYFLYVGQWRIHKNLLILVHAFQKVLERGYQDKIELVFAGKVDPKYPQLLGEVKKSGLQSNVRFIGFVDDEDLPAIYNNAICFVFPSLSEGFGLPALEAQKCAVPVISSDATSLPEVLADGALFFDPYDIGDLVSKMLLVLKDDKKREGLIVKGLENAKKFTWLGTAKKTLEVYENLLYK